MIIAILMLMLLGLVIGGVMWEFQGQRDLTAEAKRARMREIKRRQP